jgi:ATP-dependent Lon protease
MDTAFSWCTRCLVKHSCSVQKNCPPVSIIIDFFKRQDSLTKFVPAILGTPDAEARLRLATEIFIKQASISEVSNKIATAVDESLSKQQKEFFLRQQLAAIQRELHELQRSSGIMSVNGSNNPPNKNEAGSSNSSELDDDEQHEADDMADLKRRIEAMAHSSEERKMGVREWRRLKRIPAGSVENGVIRSYVSFQSLFSSLTNQYLELCSLNGLLRFLGQIRPPFRRHRMKRLHCRLNHS